MNIRAVRSLSTLTLTCLLAGCWGCGTSDYDDLLHNRTTAVRNSAKFLVLNSTPTELADTPLAIRVPQLFKGAFIESSAHPEDGPRIAPDRLQPPFLPLPGFKICYEAKLNGGEGMLPAYCYLAAVPAKPGDAAKLEADLGKQLKEKFPETGAWEAVDCPTLDGKTLAWRKIGVTTDQPFRFLDGTAGQRLTEKMFPATFELWMYDAGEYICLIGWRVPSAVEGKSTPATDVNPETGMPARPATEKLEMATLPALTAGTLTINPAGAPPP